MTPQKPEIGERLRRLRREQRLALRRVADEARISPATLSRIETNKQSLDLETLLTLSRILGVPVKAILGGDGDGDSVKALAQRIARLPPAELREVFRAVARQGHRKRDIREAIDALLSTVEVLRDELAGMHEAMRRRRM